MEHCRHRCQLHRFRRRTSTPEPTPRWRKITPNKSLRRIARHRLRSLLDRWDLQSLPTRRQPPGLSQGYRTRLRSRRRLRLKQGPRDSSRLHKRRRSRATQCSDRCPRIICAQRARAGGWTPTRRSHTRARSKAATRRLRASSTSPVHRARSVASARYPDRARYRPPQLALWR
jgi:hypothetical protein